MDTGPYRSHTEPELAIASRSLLCGPLLAIPFSCLILEPQGRADKREEEPLCETPVEFNSAISLFQHLVSSFKRCAPLYVCVTCVPSFL